MKKKKFAKIPGTEGPPIPKSALRILQEPMTMISELMQEVKEDKEENSRPNPLQNSSFSRDLHKI